MLSRADFKITREKESQFQKALGLVSQDTQSTAFQIHRVYRVVTADAISFA